MAPEEIKDLTMKSQIECFHSNSHPILLQARFLLLSFWTQDPKRSFISRHTDMSWWPVSYMIRILRPELRVQTQRVPMWLFEDISTFLSRFLLLDTTDWRWRKTSWGNPGLRSEIANPHWASVVIKLIPSHHEKWPWSDKGTIQATKPHFDFSFHFYRKKV